jgi:signal transduction histidine kinase
LSHIFERFFRVDKAHSRDIEGAGLGLAIVKSICTAHGGQVLVESVEGRGSRFKVELPLASMSHGK